MVEKNVVIVFQRLLDGVVEVGVADAGAVQPREEIGDEAQEEGHVLKDELGQVHVTQSSHQNHVLTGKYLEQYLVYTHYYMTGEVGKP